MYPKWGSVFLMVFLVVVVIIAANTIDSKASGLLVLSPLEQSRLEDFQHLQRGDLLVETVDGQMVPMMLILQVKSDKEVKAELVSSKRHLTSTFHTRALSAGKFKIIKRGDTDWCYLIEKFLIKP